MKKMFAIILVGVLLAALSFSMVAAQTGFVDLDETIFSMDSDNPDCDGTDCDPDCDDPDCEEPPCEDDADCDDNGDDDGNDSEYCTGENGAIHPVVERLAINNDQDVAELMVYFCDGHGIGQIALALHTAKFANGEDCTEPVPTAETVVDGEKICRDYSEFLGYREEGYGWGQIWKEFGNGKPKDDVPPGHAKHPKKHDGDEDEVFDPDDGEKKNGKTPKGQDKKDEHKNKDKGPDDNGQPEGKDNKNEHKNKDKGPNGNGQPEGKDYKQDNPKKPKKPKN